MSWKDDVWGINTEATGRPLRIKKEEYGTIIRRRDKGTIGMITTSDLGGYSVHAPVKDEYFFLPYSKVNEWDVMID